MKKIWCNNNYNKQIYMEQMIFFSDLAGNFFCHYLLGTLLKRIVSFAFHYKVKCQSKATSSMQLRNRKWWWSMDLGKPAVYLYSVIVIYDDVYLEFSLFFAQMLNLP